MGVPSRLASTQLGSQVEGYKLGSQVGRIIEDGAACHWHPVLRYGAKGLVQDGDQDAWRFMDSAQCGFLALTPTLPEQDYLEQRKRAIGCPVGRSLARRSRSHHQYQLTQALDRGQLCGQSQQQGAKPRPQPYGLWQRVMTYLSPAGAFQFGVSGGLKRRTLLPLSQVLAPPGSASSLSLPSTGLTDLYSVSDSDTISSAIVSLPNVHKVRLGPMVGSRVKVGRSY